MTINRVSASTDLTKLLPSLEVNFEVWASLYGPPRSPTVAYTVVVKAIMAVNFGWGLVFRIFILPLRTHLRGT